MKINSCVITGATGSAGVALIEELLKYNIKCYCVVRKSSSRINNVPKDKNIEIIECNLDELKDLDKNLKISVDVFFHLAWESTKGQGRFNPYLQLNNVKYSLDAFYLAKRFGAKAFILAGSQAEYGNINGVKSPSSPTFPNSPYGSCKLSSANLIRSISKELGIRFCHTRIFSVFGAYDSSNSLINYCLDNMLNNKDCDFTRAEQMWNFIYSKDLAKALRLIAEKGKDGVIYNLGSNDNRKLKDFILSIKKITDSKSNLNFGAIDYYKDQAIDLSCDISNLINDVGFAFDYSFEDGIRDIIKIRSSKDFKES